MCNDGNALYFVWSDGCKICLVFLQIFEKPVRQIFHGIWSFMASCFTTMNVVAGTFILRFLILVFNSAVHGIRHHLSVPFFQVLLNNINIIF